MAIEKRFDNMLADEYDLLKLAIPHYDEFEGTAAKVITDHYASCPMKRVDVIEIGCGSGITTKFLLEADPRIHVAAIDNERKMLDQFEANLKKWGAVDRVTVIEDDVFRYLRTMKDSSYDVVASGFVLHNFETNLRDALIKEIYRVLKPGGIFVNADKYANDDPDTRSRVYKEQIRRYDVYDTIGRPDYKKEWVEHMDRDEKDDLVFFEGRAKRFMSELGFKDVKTNYREMMEAVISGVK